MIRTDKSTCQKMVKVNYSNYILCPKFYNTLLYAANISNIIRKTESFVLVYDLMFSSSALLIYSYRQFVLFLVVLENSVWPMGWDSLHVPRNDITTFASYTQHGSEGILSPQSCNT